MQSGSICKPTFLRILNCPTSRSKCFVGQKRPREKRIFLEAAQITDDVFELWLGAGARFQVHGDLAYRDTVNGFNIQPARFWQPPLQPTRTQLPRNALIVGTQQFERATIRLEEYFQKFENAYSEQPSAIEYTFISREFFGVPVSGNSIQLSAQSAQFRVSEITSPNRWRDPEDIFRREIWADTTMIWAREAYFFGRSFERGEEIDVRVIFELTQGRTPLAPNVDLYIRWKDQYDMWSGSTASNWGAINKRFELEAMVWGENWLVYADE